MDGFRNVLSAINPRLGAWWDGRLRAGQIAVHIVVAFAWSFCLTYGIGAFVDYVTSGLKTWSWSGYKTGIALTVASISAGSLIIQHRRALGIHFRLWAWKSVTFLLWLCGFAVIFVIDARNIQGTATLAGFLLHNPAAQGRQWEIFTAFLDDAYDLKPAVLFHSELALWTALALLTLFLVGNRPLAWAKFRTFRWVFLASLTCAGYPATSFISRVADAMEPADWLTLLRLVAPPILLPLVGLLTVVAAGLTLIIATWLFRFVLISMPLLLFDYLRQREIAGQIRTQKQDGIAGYLRNFHLWLRGESPADIPDDSKGARLAAAADVAAARAPADSPVAMGYGHQGGAPLLMETDKHVLIMASTRSGKGVTLIIPHLLRYRGSAFVLDPKGENARATGRRRAVLNARVHYLDPFGISGRPKSRFNPLAHFTPATMEAQSKSLAAALIIETTRDHWTASAQQLLAAIILYVVASPALPPARKDLVTVRKLLLSSVKQCLQEMQETDLADGLVADLAASFLKTPDRELGSIISTAQRETEILDNPAIVACLSAAGDGAEVDFADWHRGTMSVFLCLSAPKFPVFNRWLRLVLTSALDAMTDQLDPPPLPVCFMLDELATLGHLNAIENAVGLAAGYGVQLVSVFQDVAQMRDLYKGRWASFIGNAGVRALFNLDDYETAEYWSKFIGGRLTPTTNEQRDVWGIAQGASAGEAMRPLISPEDIMMRYARDYMLVLKQGHRPIEADRIPYWRDTSLTGLWDDPRMR